MNLALQIEFHKTTRKSEILSKTRCGEMISCWACRNTSCVGFLFPNFLYGVWASMHSRSQNVIFTKKGEKLGLWTSYKIFSCRCHHQRHHSQLPSRASSFYVWLLLPTSTPTTIAAALESKKGNEIYEAENVKTNDNLHCIVPWIYSHVVNIISPVPACMTHTHARTTKTRSASSSSPYHA